MGPLARHLARPIFVAFNISIVGLILACSAPTYRAPVSDVPQPPSIWLQEHVVAAGETLYSIAWRYNVDHRELARANGIGGDYRIYPGQRLSLDLDRSSAPSRASSSPSSSPPVARESAPVSRPPNTARSVNQTSPEPKAAKASSGSDPTEWQWPLRGKLSSRFGANAGLNKGIDIAAKLGEPVVAAAAGDIVYSGSGLRGYGKLIIVKHSEKYLSAYAHNDRLLVKEGEVVRSGQKIAEVGSSGTDSVKLHFEIRDDGKPVDPLKYLPR